MAIISNINDKLTVSDQGQVSFNRIGTSTTTGYTFPALDGTANQILKTNGDGILTFVADENDDTLYALAGAASGTNYNLVLSADGSAQNTMVFKPGTNVTFTKAANSLTINSSDQYVGTVTSVGYTHQGNAFTVGGQPITSSGTIAVTMAGTSSQYIDGAGNLANISTLPDSVNDIAVTVAAVGGANKYFLDGVQQANAVLQPGFTYRFDQSNATNNNHPLRFSITSDGTHNSGVAYTTGVTVVGTPGSAGAYTQIITTQATPVTLYYYCTNHSGMGDAATIRIIQTDGTGYFANNVGIGAANIEGRLDVRMNFLSQSWIPDGTSARWGQVWDNAGTPGTYFDDVVLHVDTNRNGGVTGGVVGIAFSPGWQGHQNWGIYSFNTSGSSYTSGDLAFTSQLNDGTIIERVRFNGVNGNVGIGTSAPDSRVEISAGVSAITAGPAVRISKGASPVGLIAYDTLVIEANDVPTIRFGESDGTVSTIMSGDNNMRINSTSPIKFYTAGTATGQGHNGQGGTFAMIIDNSQNVGIGATSPGEKLEIAGNIRIHNSTNAPYIDFVESGATTDSKARITMDQVDTDNGTLLFSTEGSGTLAERMRIASSGQIVFPRTGQPPITNSLYGNIVLDSDAVTNFQRIRYDVGTTPYWGLTRLNSGNFAITGGSTWNDHAFSIQYSTQNVGVGMSSSVFPGKFNVSGNSGLVTTGVGDGIFVGPFQGNSAVGSNWAYSNSGATYTDFCSRYNSSDSYMRFVMKASATPVYAMTIRGDGRVGVIGTFTAAGDVVAYSDKKLKKNIKTLDGSKVYDMRGVSFTRKDTGKNSSGVIAQEIEKIAPELVNETDGTLGVAYGNLTGYLIEAIKDLKAEIEELKSNKCNCNK